jgi:hypothetical protein
LTRGYKDSEFGNVQEEDAESKNAAKAVEGDDTG